MEFRIAATGDLKHVTDMRIAYLTATHGALSRDEKSAVAAQLSDYCGRHMGKDFFAYFAFADGKPVSSVYLLIQERPANLSFIKGKTGVLLNVYTRPEFRRQRLATALLKMAIEQAGKSDCSNIELQATDIGVPVYGKLGFAVKQSPYTSMEYRFDARSDNTAAKP